MQHWAERFPLFLRRFVATNSSQSTWDRAKLGPPLNSAATLPRYACALATVFIAVGTRLMLDPLIGSQFPFALVFLAVLVTAWYGGFRPALFSAVLGALASDYFLLPVRHSFKLQGSIEQFGMALYLVTAVGISGLGGALHYGRRKAQFHAALVEQLVEQTYDPVLVWEWNGPIVFWNDAAEKLYGYSSEEALGRVSHQLLKTITQGGVEKIVADLSHGGSWEGELQHKAKGGRSVLVESRMRFVHDSGHTLVIEGNRDITQRKHAEVALMEANEALKARSTQLTETNRRLHISEETSRLAFEGVTNMAIFMLDPAGEIVNWNSGAQKIKGYGAAEIVGQSFTLFYPAEDVDGDKPQRELRTALEKGFFEDEGLRIRKDGSQFWALVTITPVFTKEEGNKLIGFFTIVRDLTEKKRSEETLRAAEEKSRELIATFDKAQAIVQKLDGTIVFWNSASESLYGWSREEALGRKAQDLLQAVFSQPREEIETELMAEGSWKGEFMQRRRDGSTIWVASAWALHRDASGEPVSIINVNTDITDLKRTSEALRASEATVRSLFDNASQAILSVDAQGTIVDCNTMVEELLGYTHSELIGSPVDRLLPESLRERHRQHRATYEKNPHTRAMGEGVDLVAKRKDGSELPVEISLSHVEQPGSGSVSVAFISDITARKAASQEREQLINRLEEGLSEKTVLLKEVHHRVKNNLAVIAGLLNMQADSLNDERASVALAESQQRVMSMALVHEYLYSTEHLDRVSFGKYVEQLTQELCSSYAIDPEKISVKLEVQDIELPVHRAIPCGLILNELLSNALKYAFPNGRKGEILVTFVMCSANELILSCEDDGIGIPNEIDWENLKSMGLQIVSILSKQLDGSVHHDLSKSGTRFELRLPGPKALAQKA